MVALVGAGASPRGNILSSRHHQEGHVLTYKGLSGPWAAAWHLVRKMTQGPFPLTGLKSLRDSLLLSDALRTILFLR